VHVGRIRELDRASHSLVTLQHFSSRGKRNLGRLFAADAGNPDRANQRTQGFLGQAFGTIAFLESPPL